MRIGVLALQGDFLEHALMFRSIGAEVSEVRLPEHLEGLDGLVIPGGESTTIGKLAMAYHLLDPLRAFGRERAMWGTCAGAIFMAKEIGRQQPLLELMDIVIERNAFGRQVDSFTTDLQVAALAEVSADNPPYHAVFIRAPLIRAVADGAQAIATLADGRIVAARQGKLLASSFHPELTRDTRFHQYFMMMAGSKAPG